MARTVLGAVAEILRIDAEYAQLALAAQGTLRIGALVAFLEVPLMLPSCELPPLDRFLAGPPWDCLRPYARAICLFRSPRAFRQGERGEVWRPLGGNRGEV